MSLTRIDVVLLPGDTLGRKAVEASRTLASLSSKFTLDNENYFAHMSLYMCMLDDSDVSRLQELLDQLAASISKYELVASRYDMGTGWDEGYIDIEYEATDELHQLQQVVLDAFNPLRTGMRPKDVAKMEGATGEKRANFEQYGYGSIGSLFRPHVTFTRFHEYQKDALNLLPDVSEFTGTFDKLAVFEMGDNGTCVRLLASADL